MHVGVGTGITLGAVVSHPGLRSITAAELSAGVRDGERNQVLLGATGTGKTYTMAKVIEETQRPAIILAPNKTLAAQLYGDAMGSADEAFPTE